ncbi:thiamine-phosphate kinase [Motiliproteus sp. MSK22-1]|uniref:thiamine-phosphate kinase n=1 Tax=Motiliproteus sp. MSK22-1 TaxID=1897630 RepID=UPI000975D8C0|nr:thiamine-phosphate kinase [Motiliproteus sp. MSK22-1]OMH39368.1 thiamine-phosphate kinase [Motiliproteus sp. MSK22-1]
MSISEFSLIERYFTSLEQQPNGVALGIGDDCALLEVPDGYQLAVSIDTLVEGVHFLPGTPAEHIASRVFGACLSDLAAMGAEPAWITLALTIPRASEDWLEGFSRALSQKMTTFNVTLVGGDTTRGHLTISMQVHGWVPKGQALQRNTAKINDYVFVSGTLGDSAAGLDQLKTGSDKTAEHRLDKKNNQRDYLIQRFQHPEPRISTGLAIRTFASAAIDISDGLLADLGHILEQSKVGATIEEDLLPISNALAENYDQQQVQRWALTGGEDFELCFCIPEIQMESFQQALEGHPVKLTCIGQLTKQQGIILKSRNGKTKPVAAQGYEHF